MVTCPIRFVEKNVREQKYHRKADKLRIPNINNFLLIKHCQHLLQDKHCPEMAATKGHSFLHYLDI